MLPFLPTLLYFNKMNKPLKNRFRDDLFWEMLLVKKLGFLNWVKIILANYAEMFKLKKNS